MFVYKRLWNGYLPPITRTSHSRPLMESGQNKLVEKLALLRQIRTEHTNQGDRDQATSVTPHVLQVEEQVRQAWTPARPNSFEELGTLKAAAGRGADITRKASSAAIKREAIGCGDEPTCQTPRLLDEVSSGNLTRGS